MPSFGEDSPPFKWLLEYIVLLLIMSSISRIEDHKVKYPSEPVNTWAARSSHMQCLLIIVCPTLVTGFVIQLVRNKSTSFFASVHIKRIIHLVQPWIYGIIYLNDNKYEKEKGWRAIVTSFADLVVSRNDTNGKSEIREDTDEQGQPNHIGSNDSIVCKLHLFRFFF